MSEQEPGATPVGGLRQSSGRFTIGLLTTANFTRFAPGHWLGVIDAAREQDVNVVCFLGEAPHSPQGFYDAFFPTADVGKALGSPGEFRGPAGAVFDLVDSGAIDGLIVWTSVLNWFISHQEMEDFCKRYHLPVVSAEVPFAGIPSVLIDDYGGMYSVVSHLIEAHGYRRIAFLRGSENHVGMRERYRGYVAALADHGLALDPNLLTPPTSWDGRVDMKVLLDERGLRPRIDFDAVVAVGGGLVDGIHVLFEERGIQVPGDVAVVGFDNPMKLAIYIPPYTMVDPQVYEVGGRAVELMLALLRGGDAPERTTVPARLIVRQSCGCLDRAVITAGAEMPRLAHAALPDSRTGREAFEDILAARRADLLAEIDRASGIAPEQAADFLDAFSASLKDAAPGLFFSRLESLVRQAVENGEDPAVWHEVLSALRRALQGLAAVEISSQIEDIWQQGRVLIGETARRAQAYQAMCAEQRSLKLREVETALLNTYDMRELANVLARSLSHLGIPNVYLSLYEHPLPDQQRWSPSEWSRLIVACDETGQGSFDAEGRRFRSRQLAPEGVLPRERQYSLVVESLYFREHSLGFVLFEIGPREGIVYETLREGISNALYGDWLLRKRQQVEEALLAQQQALTDQNQHLEQILVQLRAAKEQAEAANAAKNAFLASMSHELRTPLNGILGYAQILMRKQMDNDAVNGLSIIEQSGEHLLTLINDILDLAKIEAGKLELAPTPLHLPNFLYGIVGIIRARAETKQLSVAFEAPPDLPEWVRADETRLRQVLLNLLGNAVKFTDRGQVTLRVSVVSGQLSVATDRTLSEDDSNAQRTTDNRQPTMVSIRFTIEDTGSGIAPDQLERIFQPFEQAGEPTRQVEGTGLGLAISHQLVRLMGGELHVESEVGRGSTFWFAVVLPASPPLPQAAQAHERTITDYSGPRRTVLVVDDIPPNRAVLADMLQPLGFRVLEAEDGRQALDVIQQARPDLILMDRRMPVLSGPEAVQQIRKLPDVRGTPIIAISASVSEADQALNREAGYDAFLPKPIHWPQLAALLEQYLQLDWVYAAEPEADAAEVEVLVPPPAGELAILAELTAIGDILALQARATQLEQQNPQWRPFARKLERLAGRFELDQILVLLSRYQPQGS